MVKYKKESSARRGLNLSKQKPNFMGLQEVEVSNSTHNLGLFFTS